MLATLRPSRIICSDLLRTQQTAEPLARILDLDVAWRPRLPRDRLRVPIGVTPQGPFKPEYYRY